MDSQWFNEAVGFTGGFDHHNEGDQVDLTLKLGLPNDDNNQPKLGPCASPILMTPQPVNLNFNDSLFQGMNHHGTTNGGDNVPLNLLGMEHGAQDTNINNHGMVNEAGNAGKIPYGMFNGVEDGIATHHFLAEKGEDSLMSHNGMDNQGGKFLGEQSFNGGIVMGIPAYDPNYYGSFNFVPPPTMSVNIEIGSSSGSGRRGPRRQIEENYNDPNKRCTNRNCNTNNTPMWRRGPLGPKTLCNACGIKYRKEEERRRARGASNN